MCHPRRDESELIPRQEYIEPFNDESDSDDEEIPETNDESEDTEDTFIEEIEETDDESEDTQDTCIEESDESEDIGVSSSEEFHVPEVVSSDENFNSEEDARERRIGQVSARHTRHAQPSRNEISPSSSGVTFNGFTQNLEPEEITGYRIVSPTEMRFSVRWRDHPETRLIELSVMLEHRPDMILDYLRAMVARLPDNIFPSVHQNE